MIVYGIRCDTCGVAITDSEYSYKYGALRDLLLRTTNNGWKMVRSNEPDVPSKHHCPDCVAKNECKVSKSS